MTTRSIYECWLRTDL